MAENYYSVFVNVGPKTASAWTKFETPVSYDLIDGLAGLTSLPFEMVLKKTLAERTGTEATEDLNGIKHFWLDLQPNNLACRSCHGH